jgi:hypothetical protein
MDIEAAQANHIILYAPDIDSTVVQFSIEERVYRLERDEDALLARLKNTNLRAAGVDNFLF